MESAVKAKNEVSRYVQTDSQKQLHAPEDSMQLHLYREIDKLQNGIFTALVRGMYYFTGTVFHEVNVNTAVRLMKNNETIVTLWETYGHTGHGSVSNSAILQLEIGDNVYLQLAANTYIFDNHNHHSTFHGFLLFPN
ncbi:CO8A1 protein, partial [Atractosteus spatula]|nr:CO8A1 protein [Atractosteus spatula]